MRTAVTCLAAFFLAAPAAHAAFPGENGSIAFSRGAGLTEDVYAKAPDGTETPIVTTAGRQTSPAYSPDGARIAYVTYENGAADVYVANSDGSGAAVNITDDNAGGDDLDPSWSDDGTKIVFASGRQSQMDVYVTSADGSSTAQRLTPLDNFPDTDPVWSPDGDTIAFESTRDAQNAEIWAMDADGGDQRNLTDTASGSNIDPSWSPDSAQIAYSRSTGPTQIYKMDADGSDQVQLTAATAERRPAFSPDGARIAWLRGGELWTMLADGSQEARLAENVNASGAIDWQPVADEPDPEPTATPDPTATASPTATPEPDKGGGGGGGGNPLGGAVVALWEGGGPPSPTCAKSAVRFGDVEVLASCWNAKGRGNVATGRVRVNGLDILPAAGAEIEVDVQERTITSTRPVNVYAGGVRLFAGRLDWDLSRGRLEIPIEQSLLKLIRLTGTATIATDGLGRFRVALLPRIDSVFDRFVSRLSAAGGAGGLRLPQITGDATLRTENARGLSLESLRVEVESVPIGLLEVRTFTIGYDAATGSWKGTAELRLPGPEPRMVVDVAVSVRDGAFERASLLAAQGPPSFTIGFGMRLERLALDVRTDPFRLGGDVALYGGPRLGKFGHLIKVDGSVDFTAGNPSKLTARGRSSVGPAIGTATYTSLSTGRQDFTGDIALAPRSDLGLFGAVRGIVDQRAFVLLGSVTVRIAALEARGDGLVSSVGVAACIPIFGGGGSKGSASGTFRVGFGFRFLEERLDVMGHSCDVAPWSPVALGDKAGGSGARAAQDGALAAVTVPGGLPAQVFEVTGTQAPPRVTVAGPGGVRATTPADPAATKDGEVVFLRSEQDRRTYVLVPGPAAGRWTLTLESGSSPVASVRRAAGLPAPRVKATVKGKGHRRTLTWSLRAQPGQVVRFSEEGGQVARAIASTRKARGSVRFRPADGPAGRRTIVAVAEQEGMARERLVAGRYAAPAPQRPGRPKGLALRRRGGALQLRWKKAAAASGYEVRAELSDGRRLLVATRKRTLRIPAFGPRESAKVTVTGVRGPYEGRPAAKRLKRSRR